MVLQKGVSRLARLDVVLLVEEGGAPAWWLLHQAAPVDHVYLVGSSYLLWLSGRQDVSVAAMRRCTPQHQILLLLLLVDQRPILQIAEIGCDID